MPRSPSRLPGPITAHGIRTVHRRFTVAEVNLQAECTAAGSEVALEALQELVACNKEWLQLASELVRRNEDLAEENARLKGDLQKSSFLSVRNNVLSPPGLAATRSPERARPGTTSSLLRDAEHRSLLHEFDSCVPQALSRLLDRTPSRDRSRPITAPEPSTAEELFPLPSAVEHEHIHEQALSTLHLPPVKSPPPADSSQKVAFKAAALTLRKRYPYEGEPIDSRSTFLHRLVFSLITGKGTTLLSISQMGSEVNRAAVREAESTGLLKLVQVMLARAPTLIYLKEQRPPSDLSAVEWRTASLEKKAVEGPVAARKKILGIPNRERDRLSFIKDCPKGLLRFIVDNATNSAKNLKTTCSSKSTNAEADLFYRGGGAAMSFFQTKGASSGDWVCLDFRPWLVLPAAYAMASYHPIHQGPVPRNWEFQGSCDGENWFALSRHCHDACINGDTDFGYWQINQADSFPCSMVRVQATGSNALGTKQLQVSHLELFGRVLCCEIGSFVDEAKSSYFSRPGPAAVDEPSKKVKLTAMPEGVGRRKSHQRPTELPPEPQPKKGKGKKGKGK